MPTWKLILRTRWVSREGKNINLTAKEFSLLLLLARNRGKVVAKQDILEKVWELNFDTGTNTIEVYISFLRNKIDKPLLNKTDSYKAGFWILCKRNGDLIMKLRFRFTIFFSLLFSLLLLAAGVTIYYLFEQSREVEFNKRLWAQAYYSYSTLYHLSLPDSVQKIVVEYTPNSISQLEVFIINDDGKLQYQYNRNDNDSLPTDLFSKIRKNGLYHDSRNNIQRIACHVPSPHPAYLISSGYDKFGIKRVASLAHILTIVVLVGISLIIFSATVIVNRVTRPLIRLGLQMQGISENNLQERIILKARHLNYEESQIALHFNGMLDRLERAFELQRSFVHHASHELRTPLATMLAQTELALRKNMTVEDYRRVLESLKDDQQEMIELTNSLLILSQYERTHTSPEWPVVRLDELLYDTMGMVKRMLPSVNVSLEFAQVPDNELFLSIQGNDSLIRSAFRNLIKNAWLYSDNKSVAVTIDATGADIYLHFDNNGKLLSLDEQERLFIPFFRASNSTAKKGFGLGLNIIQRIVSLHRGSIGYLIYNNLNRFTLQFPKLQSATANS